MGRLLNGVCRFQAVLQTWTFLIFVQLIGIGEARWIGEDSALNCPSILQQRRLNAETEEHVDSNRSSHNIGGLSDPRSCMQNCSGPGGLGEAASSDFAQVQFRSSKQ